MRPNNEPSKVDYFKLNKEDFSDDVIREMVDCFERDEDAITPVWILYRAGFTLTQIRELSETRQDLGLDPVAIDDLEQSYIYDLERQKAQIKELNHEQKIQ